MTDSEKIDLILSKIDAIEDTVLRIENIVSAISATLGMVAEID